MRIVVKGVYIYIDQIYSIIKQIWYVKYIYIYNFKYHIELWPSERELQVDDVVFRGNIRGLLELIKRTLCTFRHTYSLRGQVGGWWKAFTISIIGTVNEMKQNRGKGDQHEHRTCVVCIGERLCFCDLKIGLVDPPGEGRRRFGVSQQQIGILKGVAQVQSLRIILALFVGTFLTLIPETTSKIQTQRCSKWVYATYIICVCVIVYACVMEMCNPHLQMPLVI